ATEGEPAARSVPDGTVPAAGCDGVADPRPDRSRTGPVPPRGARGWRTRGQIGPGRGRARRGARWAGRAFGCSVGLRHGPAPELELGAFVEDVLEAGEAETAGEVEGSEVEPAELVEVRDELVAVGAVDVDQDRAPVGCVADVGDIDAHRRQI